EIPIPSLPSSAWERTVAKLRFANHSRGALPRSPERLFRRQPGKRSFPTCVPKPSLGTRRREDETEPASAGRALRQPAGGAEPFEPGVEPGLVEVLGVAVEGVGDGLAELRVREQKRLQPPLARAGGGD